MIPPHVDIEIHRVERRVRQIETTATVPLGAIDGQDDTRLPDEPNVMCLYLMRVRF